MTLLLVLLGACWPAAAGGDWEDLWRGILAGPSRVERAGLVARFEDRLGSARSADPREDRRRRVARAALGLDRPLLTLPEGPSAVSGEEWVVEAGALQDERAGEAHLLMALRDLAPDLPGRRALHQAVFEAFLRAEGAFDPRCLPLARALHEDARAPFSLACWEGAARRLGEGSTLLAVLQAEPRAASSAERGEAAGRLALLAASLREARAARGGLGTTLVVGQPDGAQILGLRCLLAGDRPQAAPYFAALLARARLGTEDPAPWALRGFGVALLPQSH